MGFSFETMSRVRIIQLIVTVLILVHWFTCYYFVGIKDNYEAQFKPNIDGN